MTVDDWLEAYGESHKNPTNKAIHWVCVPAITVTLVALLSLIPLPGKTAFWHPGTVFLLLVLLYYAFLSVRLALGMVFVAAFSLLGVYALSLLPLPLWQSALGIFAIAWVGQFIGHEIEGKKPSFFQDLQFLLIGPMWLLAHLYQRLGIRYV